MATSSTTTTINGTGQIQPRRDHNQALLLPFNRRLRNLQSIAVRNLSLEQRHTGRARSGTIDDDADPKSFISPSRLRALQEGSTLGHSQSSSDLRQDGLLSQEVGDQDELTNQIDGSPTSKKHRQPLGGLRVRPGKLRRRSTLDWSNLGPRRRQEKLESVVSDRMVNVFFSLHVSGLSEPVYVSEIAYSTINPSFRSLDISHCGSGINREQGIAVLFWYQASHSARWQLWKKLNVHFESLRYLGKTIATISGAFEQDTILFRFPDGIYTLPSSFPLGYRAQQALHQSSPSRPSRTSTFDALLRLAKLTDSIQDALATRKSLVRDLDQLLHKNKMALIERYEVAELEDRLKTIDFAKSTVVKQIEKAKRQIAERKTMLDRRKQAMADDQNLRKSASLEMQNGKLELPQLLEEREIRKKAIAGQHRRVAEDLGKIFCLKPQKDGKALAFTIRGLSLPNAEDIDTGSSATVSAALGYVAHLMQLFSFYYDIPMPYPVNMMGSSTWISDPISLIKSANGPAAFTKSLLGTEDKTYPLYLSRVARFRFDYGVFLLNKNIQLLLESGFGVRVLDIRHTLPNLKYLLYIATAGEGELPARKAGGVRGLAKGNGKARLSRESSSSSLGAWVGNMTGRSDGSDGKSAASSLQKLVKH